MFCTSLDFSQCVSVFQVAVLCNNAVITNDNLLGQPTEGALLFAAMKVSIA